MTSASRGGGGSSPRASTGRTSGDRLQRLLALVPYVISRQVVGLPETAAAFGVTERELIDDLNLLWCVELRAPDPYCPIDLSYEGGEIEISQAEPMDRPLRLGVDEASALLVALRMLADVGSLAESEEQGGGSALSRTIAKLEAAAGEAAAPSAQVAVQLDQIAASSVLGRLQDALARGRRVHLKYYVPGRDEATERDVDPMRLLVVEGRTYLEGWCRRAEDVRLFRADRVLGIEVLPAVAEIPQHAQPVDLDRGLYRPAPDDLRVVLELAAAGRWVTEYYPCEEVTELGDGRLRVVLRAADRRWVRRLLLGLGEDGQLTEPAALASEVSEAAGAALAQYAQPRDVFVPPGRPGA